MTIELIDPTPLLLSERGAFDINQTNQLLGEIKAARVMRDGKGHSHLPQQDVIAHMIRCFGFSGFSYTSLGHELLFEQVRPESQVGVYEQTVNKGKSDEHVVKHERKDNPQMWRWDVGYRASYRLVVFDRDGNIAAGPFDDSSTGDAQNQTRADAHDLALKSAISLARKRCAIALGDQFGLALYNKGRTNRIVGSSHVVPEGYWEEMKRRQEAKDEPDTDLQGQAPKPESLGVDETHYDGQPADPEHEGQVAHTLGAEKNDDTRKTAEEQAGMPSQQEGS